MYKIEPCGRGKISKAALFVKNSEDGSKAYPPCLLCIAITFAPKKICTGAEREQCSIRKLRQTKKISGVSTSALLSFCMSGLPDCYEGTCSTMSIKRVYVVAVYLMLVY